MFLEHLLNIGQLILPHILFLDGLHLAAVAVSLVSATLLLEVIEVEGVTGAFEAVFAGDQGLDALGEVSAAVLTCERQLIEILEVSQLLLVLARFLNALFPVGLSLTCLDQVLSGDDWPLTIDLLLIDLLELLLLLLEQVRQILDVEEGRLLHIAVAIDRVFLEDEQPLLRQFLVLLQGLVEQLLLGYGVVAKYVLNLVFLDLVELAIVCGLGSTVSTDSAEHVGKAEMVPVLVDGEWKGVLG